LLAQVLASTSRLYGSIVVGSANVHWKSVHAASGVIKYLEENTLQSLGNFRFAALSNVPAYTPFYPGSFHQGLGRQFAVALESANVVAEVMAVRRDEETTRNALIAELGCTARAVETRPADDREPAGSAGWTFRPSDKEASIASAPRVPRTVRTNGTAAATITAACAIVHKTGTGGVMMPGRQAAGAVLGRGRSLHGSIAGLFGGLRHWPGGSVARR
jgi:hypothetical protein